MSQTKKSLYDLYPRMTDRILADIRKGLPKRESRLMKDKEIINLLIEGTPEFVHSLNFHILSEEDFGYREGSHAIFPESRAVLDNLLRAKYAMDTPEGFSLPYSSFLMAIPNGYSFDGIQLPSFMATWLPYRTTHEYTTDPFCRRYDLTLPENYGYEESTDETNCLIITFRDPKGPAYIRTMQVDAKLPIVLKCQNAQEFSEAIGRYEDKVGVIELDEQELEMQFLAVKLIAALGVYHMATGGSRLVDGFPGKQEPRIHNRIKTQRLRFSTLKNKVERDDEPQSPDAFYRTWFFRQLRDERYYRGEHEKTPRGSRYSFVSDTVVGQKVSAHTQKVE